jgi:single-stranded-DNA-specific exonuclease
VGVTFNLAMALRRRLRERGRFGPTRPEPNLREALDLVALGTVADVVPLVEVNRTLVRFGLAEIGKARRPGVRSLLRVAGVATGEVSASQVGFRLAPRINAAGRLDDAGRGVRLLSTADPAAADALAEELDRENRARQEIERQILEEALADAAACVAAGARGLVLSRPGWHPGVVGIVASRVVERFHRPAVLVGVADGVGKGSGRSIERFHLHDALSACSASLLRFGGHKHAAGVTIDPQAIPAFREAFERHAASVLRDEDLVPRTRIEGWIDGALLDERAATDLERLAPFGAGNPEPVFGLRARPSRARQVGAAGVHLKLVLADRDAIAFQLGDRIGLCGAPVEAAVSIGFDDWDGMRRLQLRVRDLRAAAEAPMAAAGP